MPGGAPQGSQWRGRAEGRFLPPPPQGVSAPLLRPTIATPAARHGAARQGAPSCVVRDGARIFSGERFCFKNNLRKIAVWGWSLRTLCSLKVQHHMVQNLVFTQSPKQYGQTELMFVTSNAENDGNNGGSPEHFSPPTDTISEIMIFSKVTEN